MISKAKKAESLMKFLYDNYQSDYITSILWITRKVLEKIKYVDAEYMVANEHLNRSVTNKKELEESILKINNVEKTSTFNREKEIEEKHINYLSERIKQLDVIRNNLKSLTKDLEVLEKNTDKIDNISYFEIFKKAYKSEIDIDYLCHYINLKIPDIFYDELENEYFRIGQNEY